MNFFSVCFAVLMIFSLIFRNQTNFISTISPADEAHEIHLHSTTEFVEYLMTGTIEHIHDHDDQEAHSHTHRHSFSSGFSADDFVGVNLDVQIFTLSQTWSSVVSLLNHYPFKNSLLRPPIWLFA